MNVLVIDGQGGKLGREIVEKIKANFADAEVTAVGTNTLATVAMQKGGADNIATGENAVVVCAKTADVIVGPIGVAIANSLFGEITPKMAEAVGSSSATKILIPLNKCKTLIAGVSNVSVSAMLDDVIGTIAKIK